VVGVGLADDERDRVPFAVVGVLLVLGSTAYATTLSTRGLTADGRTLDRATGDDAPTAPVAGLPVAPVPGYWYLTVNVWRVTVRGEWSRFAVRTRRGVPGEELTYVRDG
jgi:hypothetical protein